MATFEKMFSDAETGADDAKRAATNLVKNANQLRKAAQDGNISNIKKASERLGESLNTLRQVVTNAASAWSFKDEEVSTYMAENYADELRQEAGKLGFDIFERDGILTSYPSTIRLLPAEKALRIDKKKISNVRPSKLASTLLANREKKPAFRPAIFLEALYKAYNIVARSQNTRDMFENRGSTPVVPLNRIYTVFTLLPGSNREYDKMDFARDIYFLDSGDTKETKSGAKVSFPTSTAVRGGGGIISFVGHDGSTINYYGLKFSGNK